jgi:peptide deformylase
MALLNILRFPDARLRQIATAVETFDDSLKQFVNDMLETMYEGCGVGLAATQVNVGKRVLVLDVSDETNQPQVFINPEIITQTGKTEHTEGCLSVPGVYEKVTRSAVIQVRAFNAEGQPFELEATDLLGVCIQHEIDHLNGKLFIDHLSTLKRQRILKKLQQQQRQTF